MDEVLEYVLYEVLKQGKRLGILEERMASLEEYAAEIDTYTTQQGEDVTAIADALAELNDELANRDQAASDVLGPAVDRLRLISGNLHEVATSVEKPVPDNPEEPPVGPNEEPV